MKHLMKVSLMALVAMFAFSNPADAQFGKLLKKAKQAAGLEKSSSMDQRMEALKKEEEAEKAKKAAMEDSLRNAKFEVLNWKTGQKESVKDPFLRTGVGVKTTKDIYSYEANFTDKESKQKVAQAFIDWDKFTNRKREDNEILKDRKVVAVLFCYQDWKLYKDTWGNIKSRFQDIFVISELTNGLTIYERFAVENTNTGGGTYSNSYDFTLIKDGFGLKNQFRDLVSDWKHKDNADPLADL